MSNLRRAAVGVASILIMVGLGTSGCNGDESTTGAGGSSASTTGGAGGGNTGGAGGGNTGSAGGGHTGGAGGGTPGAWAPMDPADALKAAAFIGSCVPEDETNSYLHGFYTLRGKREIIYEILRDAVDCLKNKANGCAAVEECIGIVVDTTGPCDNSCDAGKLIFCDDAMKYQVDCAKHMLECSANTVDCVSVPPPPSCDLATFVGTCEAGAPLACTTNGVESGLDCAAYGFTCGPLASGGVGCRGTGADCEPFFGEYPLDVHLEEGTCQGGKLNVCVNGGEALIDCGMLGVGFTCQTLNGTSFCGLASECNPGQGQPTCEGDSVVICNAGRIDKVSCPDLGFMGCSAFYGCVPGPYGSP